MFDIIIIGGGPAGLTAALYARRANKSVLVIEKETFGGQITHSPKVENIPGFLECSGNEFAQQLLEQVLAQGAEIEIAQVLSIEDGDTKVVHTDYGDFEGKSVIVATGVKHRLLGVQREEDFIGEGISFCAVCDGAFYEDKTVAVIGGGNSALQEAIMLSDLCKHVYVVQNLAFLTGENKLVEQLETKDNITVILSTVVDKILGDSAFEGITVRNTETETLTDISLDGMFVAIGLIPQNDSFSNVLELNSYGYVDSSETCTTATAGVFTAGDCRSKKIRQVATAVADGAVSALAACDYVDSLQ